MKTYQLNGMKCDGCVKTVTNTLSRVPGVKKVTVNLDKHQVSVEGFHLKAFLVAALKGTKFELGQEVKK